MFATRLTDTWRWRYFVSPIEYRAELRADGRRWPDTAPELPQNARRLTLTRRSNRDAR